MNSSQSPDMRAQMLLGAMSLDDKISMLYGRGDLTYDGTAKVIPRQSGALHTSQIDTTAFPDGIAQAAIWDVSARRAHGAALGSEASQKGINVHLAPGISVASAPVNRRNFEYAGEDPYLARQTAAAVVEGLQSQHVVATVKHFAAK